MGKISTFACLLPFALIAVPAKASLLTGQTVQLSLLYPDKNTVDFGPVDAVVGPGVEFSNFRAGINVDLSDTNILISFSFASHFSTATFTGLLFHDLNGTIPSFTTVTVNPATNMPGFSAARVSFDADNIWINFQSLDLDPHVVVSLDVNGVSVPEPGPGGMIPAGTAALLLFCRSARSRCVAD